MIVSIKILYNTPNTMKKMVGQTKLQMLHRNHSGGIYQAWHLSLILYHILELARALTGHYFFTVSGKDLNGKILGLHEQWARTNQIDCSNCFCESHTVEVFYAVVPHRHPWTNPCISGMFRI